MLSGEAERDAPPPALPPRPRRTLLRWLGAFLLLLLLACGAAGWLAYDFLHSPGSDPAVSAPRDIEVAVLPGATFGTLTPDLVRLGAVRDNDKFLLLLRWMRYRNLPHALKPGRFRLNTGWTPQRVMDRLAERFAPARPGNHSRGPAVVGNGETSGSGKNGPFRGLRQSHPRSRLPAALGHPL